MMRKRLLALTALCSGLAPAALAQEALPDIEVGAPLRSRFAPAGPAAPSPRARSGRRRRDSGPRPAASGARDQHGAVERDHHDGA